MTPPHLLVFPTLASVIGSTLVVVDPRLDTMGILVDRATGRLLARLAPSGTGDGEVLAPVVIAADRSTPSAFWVIDAQMRRATRFSEHVGRRGTFQVTADSTVLFPLMNMAPISGALLDSSRAFVLAGFFQGPRFARVLAGGAGWIPFGPLPPGEHDVPVRVRQQAYQTSVAPDPVGDRFVAITRYSDRIDVFSLGGSEMAAATRLRGFEPVYQVRETPGGPVLAAQRDFRYGYLSVSADSGGFFALFSGRNELEAPGRSVAGVMVERYDWHAVRRRVYGISDEAVAIAVDPGAQVLYTVVQGSSPAVIRYTLPR